MRAVNLLPPDERSAKSLKNEDPAVVLGSAVGLIVLIALSLGFFLAHSNATAQQKKLKEAQIELGKLSLIKRAPVTAPKKPTRPIIPIPAITSQETPLMQAVSGALAYRIAWDRILREFSLVVPDDVTISTLSMTAPPTIAAAPGSTTTATGLTLQGLAYSHDSVARLLSRLMLIPDLSDVTLSSSTAQAGAQGVQFSITASVKGAPPAPNPALETTPTDTSTTTTGSSS
jgi:Tfp pilus assembly protein PilN